MKTVCSISLMSLHRGDTSVGAFAFNFNKEKELFMATGKKAQTLQSAKKADLRKKIEPGRRAKRGVVQTTPTSLQPDEQFPIVGIGSSAGRLEAVEVFLASPDSFDLIFTDQTMPAQIGPDLTNRLLQTRPNIPIIYCTGYNSMVSKE